MRDRRPGTRGRIAFVRLGVFSHTNDSVLELLRREFPEFDVDVVDLHRLGATRVVSSPMHLYHALRVYGRRLAQRPWPLRVLAARTPYAFERTRRLLARELGRAPYVFTFQTQSVFDASQPGIAHFVYTDHTHLANLGYPAFDRSRLLSEEWIECERSIYRNATLNLTMSTNIARSIVEQYGCPPSAVACVYAGTNTEFPRQVSRGPDSYRSRHILFVGVDWERKGGPQLLAAFERVRRVYPDAGLTIVGCAPGIDVPNCRVVGRVPLGEVSRYYREASVFCLPTRLEPFGIAFLEASAHALPVVGTRIGAIPDFIEDGRSGYLVADGDVDGLAARLVELLGDPDKCRAFGEYGRRSVRERYTWEATGKRIRQAIARTLGLPQTPVNPREREGIA